MKGIILAGGAGTRLHPCTWVVNKQLLPLYDKPMIYYPLSVLMIAGIREVLIISTPLDLSMFEKLLGDGTRLGMRFKYAVQPQPQGLAQAFIIGKDFLAGDSACLILGDNILYGHGLTEIVRNASQIQRGGLVFAYQVNDPGRYGVVEFDNAGKAISIEEKPIQPKSRYAVPGLYFYGPEVCKEAAKLPKSDRGEYEITGLNQIFLDRGELQVIKMSRGIAWLDTGTYESLLEASSFVQIIQTRQGLCVACLEEIAVNNRWIRIEDVEDIVKTMGQSSYAQYLRSFLKDYTGKHLGPLGQIDILVKNDIKGNVRR